uniref:ST3 beta-galactoside alpha-2,3-sialyltransferase 1 n=1 Tax=Maylandia zebra TaxID=106582 RepID=A0A3P9BWJ9_9CICH
FFFFFFFCFFFFYTFTEKPHFLLKPKGNVGRQILCKCVLVASVRECMEADDLFLACRSVSPYLKCLTGFAAESRSFRVYETTVANLFQIFPQNPDVIQPKYDHCRTCAVVGNSGNLRRSHYGPLIDLHEVVIRMNTGITRGFEKDVGNKTTHRVMYPESAVDLDDNTHFVLFPFKIQDFEWLINASTTGFTGSCLKVWLGNKGRYPSTGFMALILALHICDEVSTNDGNWSHYWEILTKKRLRTGVHPGNYEYNIIQQLAQQQKIKFYEGLMKKM